MKKSKGELIVKNPGIFCSIQDLGRFGYANLGLPCAGAMDQISFNLANHLLGNSKKAACLEIFLSLSQFEFTSPALICLTGGMGDISLNGITIQTNKIHPVKAKSTLIIKSLNRDQIIYLGVKYGFRSDLFFGSRSDFGGITVQANYKKGDKIVYHSISKPVQPTYSRPAVLKQLFQNQLIEVFPGPEWDQLIPDAKKTLLEKCFTISANQNRMGIQLDEKIPTGVMEILTAPVFPGTVQITPSGRMIILMRDAQVTGGYPRILQLSEAAISCIAQKLPGNKIRFNLRNL